MIIFTPQNITLLVASLINLAMSIFIFFRGHKNKATLYFGLVTLSNFFWALFLAGFNMSSSLNSVRLFSSLPYLASYLVIVFLFYFSIYYPYQIFNLPVIYKWVINFSVFIVVIYTTFFYKNFVPSIEIIKKTANYNMVSHTLYAVFIVALMLASILILLKKLKMSEGYFKVQIVLIIIAIILGTIFGSYFNLFLIYWHNFAYIHIGPLFTLFINFVVFGFIITSKEKISS